MIWEKELLRLLQQAKEKIEESPEGFIEWFPSLPKAWQDQIYCQLLPRSRGFSPDPEVWINEAVQAIKALNLKQRILQGLRIDRHAFFINGSEVRECLDEEILKEWTSKNAIAYYHEPTTDQYLFSISPSLAAIKAAERGVQAMVITLKDQS